MTQTQPSGDTRPGEEARRWPLSVADAVISAGWIKVAVFSMAYMLSAAAASACMVCIELPEETLTDKLWRADTIVFARPSQDNPFTYSVTSEIQGTLGAPIPFLVNSAARRQFGTRPDIAALILRMPDGSWALHGNGGRDLFHFVQTALDHQAIWTDQRYDPDRAQAFRNLHTHQTPMLRRLALTELAKLRYQDLKPLDVGLGTDWIAPKLFDTAWLGWQPILVHLLGLHSDPQAHAIVRRHALTVRPEDRLPWLVALIEIDGIAAVDRVFDHAIRDTNAPQAVRSAALRALLIHTEATPHLRPGTIPAVRALIGQDANLAAEAASIFIRLRDFSLAPEVSQILNRGGALHPADAFVLNNYIGLARAKQDKASLSRVTLIAPAEPKGALSPSQ